MKKEQFTAMYRNLNKAKKEPKRFVWSQSSIALKRDGTPKQSKPTKPNHVDNGLLLRPVGICKEGILQTVEDKAVRDVGAWVLGVIATPEEERAILDSDNPWSLITLNPLPASRGGRCEKEFHYCRVENGKLIIEEPVNWNNVIAADFTPQGASVYLKQ